MWQEEQTRRHFESSTRRPCYCSVFETDKFDKSSANLRLLEELEVNFWSGSCSASFWRFSPRSNHSGRKVVSRTLLHCCAYSPVSIRACRSVVIQLKACLFSGRDSLLPRLSIFEPLSAPRI